MSAERAPVKYSIPDGAAVSRCRGCDADIYWLKTASGKSMPVDPDGTSHFASCPDAKKFRKGAR